MFCLAVASYQHSRCRLGAAAQAYSPGQAWDWLCAGVRGAYQPGWPPGNQVRDEAALVERCRAVQRSVEQGRVSEMKQTPKAGREQGQVASGGLTSGGREQGAGGAGSGQQAEKSGAGEGGRARRRESKCFSFPGGAGKKGMGERFPRRMRRSKRSMLDGARGQAAVVCLMFFLSFF